MNETTRTLTPADVEAIATEVNSKLFETFGFDISTTEGRLRAAAAFRTMMFWHQFWGWFLKPLFALGGTALGGWILFRLFGWPPA
jgi:hypothetical protein